MTAPSSFSRASTSANSTPRETREPPSQPQPRTQGRWAVAPVKSSDAGEQALSWEEAPPLWRRLVRGISVPAAVGILLFLVALGVTAVMVLRSIGGGGADTAEGLGPEQHAETGLAAGTDPGEPAAAPGGEAVSKLLVHLVGEVQRPGVVELPAGARVLDAIEAAGGATDLADLTALNLAREVSDGEQIQVLDTATAAQLREDGGATGAVSAPEAHQGGGDADGLVNVNTASVEELTQLSGIGPALAQRIVDWREANGRFADVGQLLEVSGIGEKTLDRFRDRVRV